MIKNRRGFTLVEMLASAITIGILSAMMYSIFLGAWISFETEITRIDLAQEASRILSVIEEDVMESLSLAVNGGNLTINFPPPLLTDPTDPSSPPIFAGTFGTGNFPESQVDYQLAVTPLSAPDLTLTRVGQTTGTSTVLSQRVDANTNFVLENNPAFVNGFILTVNLDLRDQVFRQVVSYQQTKEIVARN
ncbi:MAG: type II secretion system protein [Candidatus Omnitrophica bacterium]|nr:type II secretion system protein [Candidatus Omnitrophota bacterium]